MNDQPLTGQPATHQARTDPPVADHRSTSPTVEPATRIERVRAPRVARAALVFAATTAIVVSAAVAFAGSPTSDPESGQDAGSLGLTVPAEPGAPGWMGPDGPLGHIAAGIGHRLDGRFEITVASVDGPNIDLETANGWTRTIDATGVPITRGDEEIALSEISIGDQVFLEEERAEDGSWTLIGIHVVLPHAGGIVTDVGADSITVERLDGTTATITVTDETTYTVPGTDEPGLDDITVGDLVFARGSLADDGSLVATDVSGGIRPGVVRERLDDRFEDRFDGPFDDRPGRPWLPGDLSDDSDQDDIEETDGDDASS